MKLHRSMKQFIVFLLAFLMAFEPFAVNMVYAGSPDGDSDATVATPDAAIETLDANANDSKDIAITFEKSYEAADDVNSAEAVMKPGEYLEYMYELRGRSKETSAEDARKIEKSLAWGEWMNTISGAYAVMDDGCTDVFSFYSTLGEFTTQAGNAPMYLEALQWATNKAVLVGSFIAKITKLDVLGAKFGKWIKSKQNLMKGLKAVDKFYSKGIGKAIKNTGNFISHMQPPVGWKKGCGTGEGFVSYWRWVARKTGLESNPKYIAGVKKLNSHLSKENQICLNKGAAVIDNSKGIATSIGIGLCVVGIALDSYELVKSEDRQVGRVSYTLVKNVASLILGIGALVAMFCIPVVGQVLAVITLIWTAITLIADQFGEYNKKWKAAYKNSYWFLYSNDPEFKSYYDNRDALTDDEKSAAYILTERNFADYKDNARTFEANNKGENSYYDDKSQEAVSARVYIEMEKQGVLTSYYNRSDFQLPDFGTSTLLEMWKAKADYMSWKPTEEESVRAENRGFWGKIGHALNPMTYVSWVGDKAKSIKYNKLTKDGNTPKVYFNPDFVLMKKYQTWITANRIIQNENVEGNNNDFYRAIGIRIEQAPFNYIPLVEIDMASWNDNLLRQAFSADAFFVGVKEMMYFRNMIEPATKSVKDFTKQVTKSMKEVRESLDYFKEHRQPALKEILKQYEYSANDEDAGKALLKNKHVKKAFGWKWNKSNGDCTPRNIIKLYWNDINLALSLDPMSISQKGADCQLLLDTIQKNLDMAALMQELYDEKMDALDKNNFNKEFTNKEFNEYLMKNQFLDVKGFGIMDWLSDIYPAYSELEKYTKLYKKEIDKYAQAAENSNTGHNSFWFISWKNDDYHPKKVIEDINALLNSTDDDGYKYVVSKFEELSSELEKDGLTLNVTVKSDDEQVYKKYEAKEVEELDVEEEVLSDSEISALIPAGDED